MRIIYHRSMSLALAVAWLSIYGLQRRQQAPVTRTLLDDLHCLAKTAWPSVNLVQTISQKRGQSVFPEICNN